MYVKKLGQKLHIESVRKCQQYHYVKNSFINSESFILFIISMTGIYEHWDTRWRARESEGSD